MTFLRRNLSIGVFAAAAAGLTWAVATGVVVNYPATIRATVEVPSETISSVTVQAYPQGGGGAASTTSTGPGPHTIVVNVDGGDPTDVDGNPAIDDDPGVFYTTHAYAYLSNPLSSQTYLRIEKLAATLVNNTSTIQSAEVPLAFRTISYRVNTSINVVSASNDVTISSYALYATATSSAAGESYYGRTDGSTSSQTTVTTWVPMAPASSVQVYGTVYLRHPDGSTSQRNLARQTFDLSSGGTSTSWTIDLGNTGQLAGTIAIASPDAAPTSYQVSYYGVAPATSGIVGTISATPTLPDYAADLPPGDYDVQLRTFYNSPSSRSETARTRISITAGTTTAKNFTESFGILRFPLHISGFFTNTDLYAAQSAIRGPTYANIAYRWQLVDGNFDHVAPFGSWQKNYTYMHLRDYTNSTIPLDTRLYRYTYDDPARPPTSVNSHGVTSAATEEVSLVRANIYFDVIDPSGAIIKLSNPRIDAYKQERNGTGSLRSQTNVTALGSSIEQERSQFVMVAEPGTYIVNSATATVGGKQTTFRSGTITFGQAVTTPACDGSTPGAGCAPVVLSNQTTGTFLNVSLGFANVGSGGVTSVAETPFGPAPPEGFKLACSRVHYGRFTRVGVRSGVEGVWGHWGGPVCAG